MFRQKESDNHTFVSLIEAHGEYNPRLEYTLAPYTNVQNIQIIMDTEEYTILKVTTKNKQTITICFANTDNNPHSVHKIRDYSWQGVCEIK